MKPPVTSVTKQTPPAATGSVAVGGSTPALGRGNDSATSKSKLRLALELAGSPHGRRWLRHNTRKRLSSRHESVCLRRDLTVPFALPPSMIPLTVRRLRTDDDLSFLADEPGLDPEAAQLRRDQRWLLSCDLPTPWVAVSPEGAVCMLTYLFTAADNERIRRLWGGWLPELAPDEAMIEGIYTAERYRGLNIMPVAATQIAEQARALGVRYGLGFIPLTNSASQRAGAKAGWTPFIKREERWLLFRRRIRFLPIVDAAQSHSAVTASTPA